MFLFSASCLAEDGQRRENGPPRRRPDRARVLRPPAQGRRPRPRGRAPRRAQPRRGRGEPAADVVLGAPRARPSSTRRSAGLEADFNYKKTSNYAGRVGERVASEQCTVVDEGLFENMRARSTSTTRAARRPPRCSSKTASSAATERRISAKQLGSRTRARAAQANNYAPMPRMTTPTCARASTTPRRSSSRSRRGIKQGLTGGQSTSPTATSPHVSSATSSRAEGDRALRGDAHRQRPDVMTKVTMVGTDLSSTDGADLRQERESVPVGRGRRPAGLGDHGRGTKLGRPAGKAERPMMRRLTR